MMSKQLITENRRLNPHERLKKLLLPEKRELGIIIGYGICSGFFSLIIPIAVQTLVNNIAFGSLLQPILVLSFLVLTILGISAFLRGLQVYLMEMLQRRIFARTSLTLTQHLPKVTIETLEGDQGPELVNRFFDVLTVQKSTALIAIDGLSIILQTVVGMILLAFYHPLLLAFDLVLVGIIFTVIFYLGQGAVSTSILESKKKYEVVSWLEQLSKNSILFKHPNAQGYVFERSDLISSEYLKKRRQHFNILLKQIVGALSLQVLASSMLLGLGGWLVVKKQLTLGQLIAAELIVTSVVTGVGKFGKYLDSYYDLIAATDKLGYLLDLPTEEEGLTLNSKNLPQDQTPEFRFTDVTFAHPHQDPCLHQIHLHIQPGEKLSILGGRSSGKTTLCDLLYQLKPPQSGLIEMNGVSTRDLNLKNIRSQLSLLRSHDLFDATLLENLQVHQPHSSVEDIYAVLETLGLLEEIKKLPQGLRTPIRGGHSLLSSNQAKLICLARALLTQPKVLILDAFLDDLDDSSKKVALKALLALKSSTVILMTGTELISKQMPKQYLLDSGQLRIQTGGPA